MAKTSKDPVLSLCRPKQKSMRAIAGAVFLVLAVLICGCTTVSQEMRPPVPETPNLLGNWSGTMNGYMEGRGYTDFSNETITMRVTEQHDRIFSGVFVFSNRIEIWNSKTFAGVIGRDGRTLSIVEQEGGSCTGSLIAPNEIEVTYLDIGEPFMIAVDVLKKE
jgi:hypothetical protein